MTLPAEDISNEVGEQKEDASPETTSVEETQPTTEVIDPEIQALIEKASERPTVVVEPKVQLIDEPSAIQQMLEVISSSTLLKSDLFLSILALTLLNALIFIHYARTNQSTYDLKTANRVIREDLSKDFDYMEPVMDFINFHGEFKIQTDPQFSSSLSQLRAKLDKFGLDAGSHFFQDEFLQKNGGLYWSRSSDRVPTAYQPAIP